MKVVEITPEVNEGYGGYKTKKRRKDITEKFSIKEIEAALKTSEYSAIKQEDLNVSIQMSNSEFKYISEYAESNNMSIEFSVQWFWNQGVKLMRDVHKMRESYPIIGD